MFPLYPLHIFTLFLFPPCRRAIEFIRWEQEQKLNYSTLSVPTLLGPRGIINYFLEQGSLQCIDDLLKDKLILKEKAYP